MRHLKKYSYNESSVDYKGITDDDQTMIDICQDLIDDDWSVEVKPLYNKSRIITIKRKQSTTYSTYPKGSEFLISDISDTTNRIVNYLGDRVTDLQTCITDTYYGSPGFTGVWSDPGDFLPFIHRGLIGTILNNPTTKVLAIRITYNPLENKVLEKKSRRRIGSFTKHCINLGYTGAKNGRCSGSKNKKRKVFQGYKLPLKYNTSLFYNLKESRVIDPTDFEVYVKDIFVDLEDEGFKIETDTIYTSQARVHPINMEVSISAPLIQSGMVKTHSPFLLSQVLDYIRTAENYMKDENWFLRCIDVQTIRGEWYTHLSDPESFTKLIVFAKVIYSKDTSRKI